MTPFTLSLRRSPLNVSLSLSFLCIIVCRFYLSWYWQYASIRQKLFLTAKIECRVLLFTTEQPRKVWRRRRRWHARKEAKTKGVVVAQLVERLIPITKVRGSNPVIGKNLFINWTFVYCQLCIEKTKIKKKRPGMAHFFKTSLKSAHGVVAER